MEKKNFKDMNMKELFDEFKKSMGRVKDAEFKICDIFKDLTLPEGLIAVSHILEACIENYTDALGNVNEAFESISKVLANVFVDLKKKYDADFISVLTRKYLQLENPQLFEHIEDIVNNLRDDKEEDDDKEEGDEVVC